MGIRLLDSMCLKVGENLYVLLGLIYDRSGRILIESIAFGSRRDLIATFSKFVTEGNGQETTCMRYNNVPYTQDELFQLLEDSIEHAMSVEDFMGTHKVDHFCCNMIVDGKIRESYPKTLEEFSTWLREIREARRKGQATSAMHCCSVLKDSNAELKSFVHGDVRDTGGYVIRQRDHFSNLWETALPGVFDVEDSINVLSWNDAINRIVECHYDKAVVVRIEEAKFFLVRETGSQGKSVDGRAYATFGAARDAMEQMQKMYQRRRQISQYTQNAIGQAQQQGDRLLQIDRYSYKNGWVLEEEDCYKRKV